MYLKVQDESVRRNVEIFKVILKRSSHSAESEQSGKKSHAFRALVNRGSGEVRFLDLSSDPVESKDWVLVSFHFSLPTGIKDPVYFDISGMDGLAFSWDGLQQKALLVLKETVKTIQIMTRFLPCLRDLTAIFREFSQMELDSFLEEIPAKDLIYEAWHQISREACEKLFRLKPVGTFLFRQDEFAHLLETLLRNVHMQAIKCITLSYLAEEQKVVDYTLVKKREGWVVYDNDPLLRGPIYPTARALLTHFKAALKSPCLSV